MNKDDLEIREASLPKLIHQLDKAIENIEGDDDCSRLGAVLNCLHNALAPSDQREESAPHRSDRKALQAEVCGVKKSLRLTEHYGSNALPVIGRDARRLHQSLARYVASLPIDPTR